MACEGVKLWGFHYKNKYFIKFQCNLQDTKCRSKYSINNKAEGGERAWRQGGALSDLNTTISNYIDSHKTDSSPPVLKWHPINPRIKSLMSRREVKAKRDSREV